MLDLLDVGTKIRAILRRFYLIRLLDQRIRREKYYKNQNVSQPKYDYKSIGRAIYPNDQFKKNVANRRWQSGRADSKTFTNLLSKSYPHLKQDHGDYQEKY